MRGSIYFTGVSLIAIGIISYFMFEIALTVTNPFGNPLMLLEELRFIVTYGLLFRIAGIVMMIFGVATVIYGILAKPVKEE